MNVNNTMLENPCLGSLSGSSVIDKKECNSVNALRRPLLFILQHEKILDKVINKANLLECMFVFVFHRVLNVEIVV